MKIRRALLNDDLGIAKVHVDTWRHAYSNIVPASRLAKLDYNYMSDRFSKSILENVENIYVVEETGKIIAFFIFGICRDSDVDSKIAGEIYAMYVLPDYWRKGIGKNICREAEQILKSQTYSQIFLWVFENNNQARQFYEVMGFKKDGAIKVLNIGAPLNAIRYIKSI
jgi:ribosomal protein S18 acetylase RimI-like enzyme